jgi:hypothetical protein
VNFWNKVYCEAIERLSESEFSFMIGRTNADLFSRGDIGVFTKELDLERLRGVTGVVDSLNDFRTEYSLDKTE